MNERLPHSPRLFSHSPRSSASLRAVCLAAGAVISVGVVPPLVLAQPAGAAAGATDPTDANITRMTTGILGHSQFAHHPLDAELAGKLLDLYLDALDGNRSLFLKSDIDEFAAYRATLAQTTLKTGDTTPARNIFARYLQRLEQRVTAEAEMLRTMKFDFTAKETYSLDREHAPWPVDAAAAQALWRQQLRAEYLQEKLNDKKPDQIVTTLTRRHQQQLKTTKGLHDDEVLEIYLNALAHVYDPHSDYMGREQMESFSIAMRLSLFGIGASLETVDGYCRIRELLPGGPAARSGLLKEGDRIIAVAQAGKEPVDIMNMPLTRAVELIRGPKGTRVTLTIVPGADAPSAAPRTVALIRDEIKLADQAAKARIIDVPTGDKTTMRLGVIDLPSFYAEMGKGSNAHRSATADVARLVTKLKAENVRGIVMDLRRNGGGSLEEAISLTGLFIRKGPVVQTRAPDGEIQVGTDDDDKVLYDGPLVLLTSRFSASATEIMAGAVQDYGRGVVIGDKATFGKGTVQTIMGLAPMMERAQLAVAHDPGALKVTISKFYRPSGASTQLKGVASDIVLPSTTDFSDISEASLKNPLPWDVIPAKPYERLNLVASALPTLRAKSQQRIKTDKDFGYLAADIERVAKSLANKSISLNEAERRKELARDKASEAERAKDLQARASERPTSYEITLENADAPGLPPPGKGTKTPKPAKAGKPAGIDRALDSDAILDESVRILSDYVALLKGPSIDVAGRGGTPKAGTVDRSKEFAPASP
jgi:carboxyl-terminal processing protease